MVMRRRDAGGRFDGLLDLQGVPPDDQWNRIATAAWRLDAQRGTHWRLKILLRDGPEGAIALPRLVAQLARAGLHHDACREPQGVQSMVVAPRAENARERLPLAA